MSYLILLPLYTLLYYLGRNLFRNCTNIWEEISSESFPLYCYYQVSYIFILKEIYSEIVPICGENILLKGLLDIFTIVYHTFMFGKKFIPKIVSIFGKKILLKVVLDIVTIIYLSLLFGKKFLLKALLHIVTIKYPTFLF